MTKTSEKRKLAPKRKPICLPDVTRTHRGFQRPSQQSDRCAYVSTRCSDESTRRFRHTALRRHRQPIVASGVQNLEIQVRRQSTIPYWSTEWFACGRFHVASQSADDAFNDGLFDPRGAGSRHTISRVRHTGLSLYGLRKLLVIYSTAVR